METTSTPIVPFDRSTNTAAPSERFTRIAWGPNPEEPTITIYSNYGLAAKLRGQAAEIFTQIVAAALFNIAEQEKKNGEQKASGVQGGPSVDRATAGSQSEGSGGDSGEPNT